MRKIAEGASASAKHSFLFAEFSISEFPASVILLLGFFFYLIFSLLPIGKCVLHIFLECLLLFPPRTRAGLALWGLKLNQLGGSPLKREYKNVNIKLGTKLVIFIWNEKPQYIPNFKQRSNVRPHRIERNIKRLFLFIGFLIVVPLSTFSTPCSCRLLPHQQSCNIFCGEEQKRLQSSSKHGWFTTDSLKVFP